MEKKIAKIGIIAVLTLALVLSGFGGLNFGDTFAKEFNGGATNQTTAQAATTWDGTTKTAPTGAGTSASPYLIGTGAELAYLADKVNTGTGYSDGKFFKLTADIVLNDTTNWTTWNDLTPGLNVWGLIGDSTYAFMGMFDGNGHTVSGVYISNSSPSQGLFGVVEGSAGKTATVKNVAVINSYIKGGNHVGGVVGFNNANGTVTNCSNSGTVKGDARVGGVVGTNDGGAVINCFNTGVVTGSQIVGGVVGRNEANATIINCYNTGAVTAMASYAGGVAGLSNGAVNNCYNTGAVTATTSHAGGLVGYNVNGAVNNCYNTGAVSIKSNTGGVAGRNDSALANCYFLKTTSINDTLNASGTAAGTKTATCGYFVDNSGTLTSEAGSIIDGHTVLLDALNAGAAAYNNKSPSPAIKAAKWVKGAGGYPKHKPSASLAIAPMADKVYTGEAQEPTVTVGSLTPTTHYTLSWQYAANGTDFLAGSGTPAFTNVGTYRVTATGVGEYSGETATADYKITIATNAWTTELSIAPIIYVGETVNPIAAAKFGVVEYVYFKIPTGDDTIPSEDPPTTIGTYVVVATVDCTDNYSEDLHDNKEFEIRQKTAGGGSGGGLVPSISAEEVFWAGIVTDLKYKTEPVVEFNCIYQRVARSVLLALQEVDKTLNINLNDEKLDIASKQVKGLTFDKASYSIDELKALLEVKPTPTPIPTEKPTEPVVPETPTANLTWLWILLAVVAVGAVVSIIVVKKKKNDNNK